MKQVAMLEEKELPEEEHCENLKRAWEEIMKLDGMAIIIRRKAEPETMLRGWIMKNWSILDNYQRFVQGENIAMAKVKLNGSRRWTYILAIKKRC